MKVFVIGFIIVVNLILQSTLLQFIKIYDVLPNMGLILVISFAIYSGKTQGALIGFIIGILQDVLFGSTIGLNALIFMTIGYLVGMINQKIIKDNLAIPFILTSMATLFYESINLLFIYLLGYGVNLINVLKSMLLAEVIYNSIISVFVYVYVSKLFKTSLMKKRY